MVRFAKFKKAKVRRKGVIEIVGCLIHDSSRLFVKVSFGKIGQSPLKLVCEWMTDIEVLYIEAQYGCVCEWGAVTCGQEV